MATFSIGGLEHNRVFVEVVRYEREACGDIHDDNWVVARIAVNAGGFEGAFEASLLTWEIAEFHQRLEALYSTLRGTAEFSTSEGQLLLTCEGDGRGAMVLRGVAIDQPGIGNTLQFNFDLDQSYLSKSISGLHDVISQFPVRSANPSFQRTATRLLN